MSDLGVCSPGATPRLRTPWNGKRSEEETHLGRVRLARVPDASAASLHPFVLSTVKPGATLFTDSWKGYLGLGGRSYAHKQVNIKRSGRTGSELLPTWWPRTWTVGGSAPITGRSPTGTSTPTSTSSPFASTGATAGHAACWAVEMTFSSSLATPLCAPTNGPMRLLGSAGAPTRSQQSNTDQQMSFRNRWSSSTSSRIASGNWSRCHRHSSRPALSPSPSGAVAHAALIA